LADSRHNYSTISLHLLETKAGHRSKDVLITDKHILLRKPNKRAIC